MQIMLSVSAALLVLTGMHHTSVISERGLAWLATDHVGFAATTFALSMLQTQMQLLRAFYSAMR